MYEQDEYWKGVAHGSAYMLCLIAVFMFLVLAIYTH